MASFQVFTNFLQSLGLKLHDLSSDTLKVYLSNAAPNAGMHTQKSHIAEIAAGNGYTAGGNTLNKIWASGGQASLVANDDPSRTASSGTIGPFRYAILYNDTAASDPLIGWWDRGSEITLADGETFTLDVSTVFLLQ